MKKIVVIAFLILSFFGCQDNNQSKRLNHDNILAYNLLADQIKEQILVSPSSAIFPNSNIKLEHTEYLGNHTYLINSYVESQNPLGVMIKTNFSSKVVFKSDGSVGFPDFKTY